MLVRVETLEGKAQQQRGIEMVAPVAVRFELLGSLTLCSLSVRLPACTKGGRFPTSSLLK